MTPVKIASISRVDLKGFEETTPSITDVKHLSSYNWIDSETPTIAIPGCPPLWSPPKARHPESPLEPLFRALYTTHPSFDIGAVDLVTDRNNIRKLLSFINPSLSKNGLEPFTIEVEVTGKTAVFCRAETETVRFLGPRDFVGFGHEFEKAYTRDQVNGRLESGYRFCFRSLPVDLAQYHTLCETYDFLGVDVVGGQTIDHIFVDLRACKTDYELEYKRYRAIKGDKTLARDAAFRLLFLILRGEFRDEANDSAKAHNAVLFIMSHPGTFKYRTRTTMRAAYE
ncbi:hypothetical protein CBS147347_4659 [Aspergillus niger]|nr:hypothetical protein CBS147347_4659 [Aspergillus niger]